MSTWLNFSNYSYANDPLYDTMMYHRFSLYYYIIVGGLSAIGNIYLVILFLLYSKLRSSQCNWLIIYLCAADVFIGLSSVLRGSIALLAFDNTILGFNFIMCQFVSTPFGVSYRIGQSIALMMAVDRLLAIWRPTYYAKKQGN
uniref:G-protein coupled receptors family 1 profile domain-containing protein n=1 Tax=Acrobeloides nanus TaxID=290746 RepID=A0A914DDH2_9BILA